MARTRTRPSAAAKPETNGDEGKPSAAERLAKAREAKAAEREKQEVEQLQVLLKRFGEHPAIGGQTGDESLGVVAKSLNITAGKAAFILMKHAVAEKKVPAITAADDDSLVKAINEARLAADRFSSWGWLAARSGKAEGWIKTHLESAGLYTPKAENIASKRAEIAAQAKAEEKGQQAAEGDEKKPTTRRRRGNAS